MQNYFNGESFKAYRMLIFHLELEIFIMADFPVTFSVDTVTMIKLVIALLDNIDIF